MQTKKRFSLGWAVGVALGLASSAAVVYAVNIPNNFSDGQTASAAAVNANFAALKAAVDALEGAPGATCTGANTSDEMVRVGTFCIDKNPAALFASTAADGAAVTAIPAGCETTGAGCSGIVAQSRADAGSALRFGTHVSWGRAAVACANAGKRLATAREVLTATHTGAITLANDDTLWVDAASATAVGAPLRGTHVNFTSGVFNLYGQNTPYTEVNSSFTGVTFRCAR